MAYEQYLDDPTYGIGPYTRRGEDGGIYRLRVTPDGEIDTDTEVRPLRGLPEDYDPIQKLQDDTWKQGVITFDPNSLALSEGARRAGKSIEDYVYGLQGDGAWGVDRFGNQTYTPTSGTINPFPEVKFETDGLKGFIQSPVFAVMMAGLGGVVALEGGFGALLGGAEGAGAAGATGLTEGGLLASEAGFVPGSFELGASGYGGTAAAGLDAAALEAAAATTGAAAPLSESYWNMRADAGSPITDATNTPNYSGPEYQSGLDDLQLRPQDTPLGPSSYGGTAAAGLTAAAAEAGANSGGGLIDRLLNWGKENQTLASAGLQVGGGLLKGAFSPSPEEIAKAKAQAEIETEAAKRAATSAAGVRARVTPTGKFLRTPYNISNGIIAGRM